MKDERKREGVVLALGVLALVASSAATAQSSRGTGGGLEPSRDKSAIMRRETPFDDSGQYRQEVQACKSGQSPQSRATCLEEARNAHAARQHGQLASGNVDYLANAKARCRPLSGEDKAACEARVMGFGQASGSVAGGGVLRSVETVVAPRDATSLRIVPKTSDTVVLVPQDRR